MQSKYVTICPNCGYEHSSKELNNEEVDKLIDMLLSTGQKSMFSCRKCQKVSQLDPLKHFKALQKTKW